MPGDPGLPGASEEALSPLDMLTMVQSSEEGSMGLSQLRNPAVKKPMRDSHTCPRLPCSLP